MRILNTLLFSEWGGAEEMGLNYAQALRETASVTCVMPLNTPMQRRLQEAALPYHVARVPSGRADPRVYFGLAVAIHRTSPDIILAHNERHAMNLRTARRLALSSAPIVSVIHSPVKPYAYRAADAFLAVSPGMQQDGVTKNIAKERIQLTPNFFLNAVPPLVDKELNGPPSIGFLGRIVEQKGVDWLIEALSLLKKSGFAFKAHIAGDGREKPLYLAQAAKAGLSNDIMWHGWVEDKAAFFQNIDMLVVPSREEPFGLVILEAWQHGVPVIATRTYGSRVLIQNYRNGLTCASNPVAIAKTIQTMATAHGVHRGIRMQAHQDVHAWHANNRAPVLVNALQNVLKAHGEDAMDVIASAPQTRLAP